MTFGILSYSAYIPRLRLSRRAIEEANGWYNAAITRHASGERAMCNWDEDAVTMAVAAARDALVEHDRSEIVDLRVASTTFPFLDRLNAGIVAEALSLPETISALDITGSQRAGTSALLEACGRGNRALVVAAENRRAKAASLVEMSAGDGSAGILLGEGTPIARLIGSATITVDFIDHYRTVEHPFDYQWEERWIRDMGYMTIVPPTIERCLESAALQPRDVTHFCMPTVIPKVAGLLAKAVGLDVAATCDNLQARCGDTGAAHPLVMLVDALEKAAPGDRILVVGFGQGADALLFEVTQAIGRKSARMGLSGYLSQRRAESNYIKFLAFNEGLNIARGMRAEVDKQTALSAFWRNRKSVTGFVGGRCRKCETIQFPASRKCVNPDCNSLDTQEPYPLADVRGRIKTYAVDRLTYTPDPPACSGMINFEDGGCLVMDFTDVNVNTLHVGQEVSMVFRIKDVDTQRGFKRYFWKAAPQNDGEEEK